MQKFIVFGRGRSGTTVIADEISRHPEVDLPVERIEHEDQLWERIEPFGRGAEPAFEEAESVVAQWEPLTYDLWRWQHGVADDLPARIAYLEQFEARGQAAGAKAVGFKIIDNQMGERVGLAELLAHRDYSVVNIHRRNVVRHALSGLLARQRGVFNERNYRDTGGPYPIDVHEFEQAVAHIRHWVQFWDQGFEKIKIRTLNVFYEDFLADRAAFHAPILEFLGLSSRTPATSDFSKMVPKDLSSVIVNFEEIQASCSKYGLAGMLGQP